MRYCILRHTYSCNPTFCLTFMSLPFSHWEMFCTSGDIMMHMISPALIGKEIRHSHIALDGESGAAMLWSVQRCPNGKLLRTVKIVILIVHFLVPLYGPV